MVIGNGMIAKKFSSYKDDDRVIIFASGVSNSKSTAPDEYQREADLLSKTILDHPDKQLVYFSTCSVYDTTENQSLYVKHKMQMEAYIQKYANKYLIIRASNVVGKSGNANTILNYFVHRIQNKIPFDLWINATRNILDMDDLFEVTNYILQENIFSNDIINVANPRSFPVREIVHTIEQFLSVKAEYSVVEKGVSFTIDVEKIQSIYKQLNINFTDNYLENILQKNYGNSDVS